MNVDPATSAIMTDDGRVFVDADLLLSEYRQHNEILANMAELAPDPAIALAHVEGAKAVLDAIDFSITMFRSNNDNG